MIAAMRPTAIGATCVGDEVTIELTRITLFTRRLVPIPVPAYGKRTVQIATGGVGHAGIALLEMTE